MLEEVRKGNPEKPGSAGTGRLRAAGVAGCALLVVGCYWQITLRTNISPEGVTERYVSVVSHDAGAVADAFDTPAVQGWVTREIASDSYAVRGVFANPTTMPTGYVRRISETAETAPSRIVWSRSDRAFYTVYEYRERITNVVTPDRFDSAAERAVDLTVDLACRVAEDYLGDTYDVSRLTAHLRERGRPALKSLAWILYAKASMEARLDSQDLARIDAYLGERLGVPGPLFSSFLKDQNDTNARLVLNALAAGRVRLKAAPDRPLTPGERRRFLDALWSENGQKAMEKVAERHMGPKDGREKLFGRLWVSLFGAYHELFGPEFRFAASVRVPGQVVQTNGYLVAPSEVEWRFGADETYPVGYEMRVVSVLYNEAAQRAAAGRVFLASPRQWWDFKVLIDGDSGGVVKTVLAECVAAGSLEPLDRLIEKESASATGRQAAAVKEFIVPAKPPERPGE